MHSTLRQAGFCEKSFHTGDVILNYVEGPPSTKPPLVFIHGQTVTWEEYTLIAPLLCAHFKVYAVTLRGHGTSSWTPGQYTFNQLGKDMIAFLRDIVCQPCVVAGNSSGGVLTSWLAANAKEYVKGIVLEDPPLFRCDWPNIQKTRAYDLWLAFTRTTVPSAGGFAALYRDFLMPALLQPDSVLATKKRPPKFLLQLVGYYITLHQMLLPGRPVDVPFLPLAQRILFRGMSQFDGNFSKAFMEGTVGQGFDHAETLARIEVPVLFLHARYSMREGRLEGALTDEDVRRAMNMVKGPWKYVRMDCGHMMALDAPRQEAQEIVDWWVGGARYGGSESLGI